MKTLNSNGTMVNQINHIQSVSNAKKNHLIEMMEKRYGIRIAKVVFVCEDRMISEIGLPDSLIFRYGIIPPEMQNDRWISTDIMSSNDITSLNDIYHLSNAGYNSKFHPINQNKKDGEKLTRLIPIILIHCKKRAYFFRLDNAIIRQLFIDTKSVIDGIKDDEDKSLNRRYLEQKEYLKYCYSPFKSELCLELWLNINFEKSKAGKGDMLHAEYLDWKESKLEITTSKK
jgi:hypothetical protein